MFASVLRSFNRSRPKLNAIVKHTSQTIKVMVFFMIVICLGRCIRKQAVIARLKNFALPLSYLPHICSDGERTGIEPVTQVPLAIEVSQRMAACCFSFFGKDDGIARVEYWRSTQLSYSRSNVKRDSNPRPPHYQ